jgi:hypothetical protein
MAARLDDLSFFALDEADRMVQQVCVCVCVWWGGGGGQR